jgi:Uma2 family endonuclease
MSTLSPVASPPAPPTWFGSLRRFSVEEYHQMIEAGILDENDNVELIEGHVVNKMSRNPPHDSAIRILSRRLDRLLPPGWDYRGQSAITLSDSEPEPDLAVVRGDERTYGTRHPGAADVGLVVEVSDSTLAWDRSEKARIYARAGIETYWIVNLVDRRLEVHTGPSGPTASPCYARRDDIPIGSSVPLVLDGVVIAALAVSDLLP